MKNFKVFYIILFGMGLLVSIWILPHLFPIFAQTCGGTTSCSSSLYTSPPSSVLFCASPKNGYNNCDFNNPLQSPYQIYTCYTQCNGYTVNNQVACTNTGGECGGCVDMDQFCNLADITYLAGYVQGDSANYWSFNNQEGLYGCYTNFSIGPYPGGNAQCGGHTDLKWCTSGCQTYCNQSPYTNCSACNYPEPTNTCGTTNTNHTCQYGGPSPCTPSGSVSLSCGAISYNNCSANYTCTNGSVCTTNITANVYTDYNHNGVVDGSDAGLAGITVTDNGGNYPVTNSSGSVTFTGKTTGTYTITITVPSGYEVSNGGTLGVVGPNTYSQSVTLSNTAGNQTVNFFLTPLYSITGNVYKDFNHDGAQNNGEPNYTASSLTVSDPKDTTTTNNGAFTFPQDLVSGTYTVILQTIPAGFQGITTSENVTIPGNTASLGITPLYTISGVVFNHNDLSQCYNSSSQSCVGKGGLTYAAGGDTAFTNGSHITIAGNVNTTANAVNGIYTSPQTLTSGTYTVTYDTGTTPLPAGYRFTTNQSFSVTVGDIAGIPACSIGTVPDTLNTKCQNPNNGSIVQLNFGVTNETSWSQSQCSDIRMDAGYSQPIPSTASCSNTSSPYAIIGGAICPNAQGVLFSGNTLPNYGQGAGPSTSGLQVGNNTYGETFVPHSLSTIESEYNLVMDSLNNLSTPATKLSSVCPVLTNCDLKTLPSGGVYTTTAADGPVTLFASGDNTLASQNYTFVIGGDLTITSNILTPVGYSAAFISGGNIHITGAGNTNAGEVGETNWVSTTPELEGFFSTDKSFYIDRVNPADATCNTDGSPIDKKLNIAGAVVTNAAGNGGSIVNNREGCLQDLTCPTMLFPPDVQVILHPPTPLKIPLTFWSELNP